MVVVIGGGPAGMMAAIRASQHKSGVILLEKNDMLGRKLLLTGNTRCNLTNNSGLDDFLVKFSGNNGQFLRDAFKVFFNKELSDFFKRRGVALRAEEKQKMFPASGKATDILDVLVKELKRSGVDIILGKKLKAISTGAGGVIAVNLTDGSFISSDEVILATGGVTYPSTGSSGEGLEIARILGHKIVPLRPALVPLRTRQDFGGTLEGITCENVRIKVLYDGRRKTVSDAGDMIFTDTGISGPLVISSSGDIIDLMYEDKEVAVEIDLKAKFSEEEMDKLLLKLFDASPKKSVRNILGGILPERLADVILDAAGIDRDKKAAHVTQGERKKLVLLIKGFRLEIVKEKDFARAMVTRGGISLKDIDPATMASRRVPGLYFAGEIMDIDADTGGFNLQAAFSTGYLAGCLAARA